MDIPPDRRAEGGDTVATATLTAIAALIINAILCAAFAGSVDTFIITNAILAAALVWTIKGERHG